jgi:hypothetical protein
MNVAENDYFSFYFLMELGLLYEGKIIRCWSKFREEYLCSRQVA